MTKSVTHDSGVATVTETQGPDEVRVTSIKGQTLAVIRKAEPDGMPMWCIDEIHSELNVWMTYYRSLVAAELAVRSAYVEALTTSTEL